MDVNHTSFHLLIGRRDWTRHVPAVEASSEADVVWNDERGRVTLRPELFRFSASEAETPLRFENRRGAGQDRYGNGYSIDEAATGVMFLPAGMGEAERFWPVPPSCNAPLTCGQEPPEACGQQATFGPLHPPTPLPPMPLRGLTVTPYHYLVVGVLGPVPGLVIFDLHAGGPPTYLRWPDDLGFHPVDMAPRPGGGLWILDVPPEGEARYWALDRYFEVEGRQQAVRTLVAAREDDFKPVGGDPYQRSERIFPGGLSLGLASPLEERHPIAIEALPDDTVLVLEGGPEEDYVTVRRYDFGQQLGEAVSLRETLAVVLEPGSDLAAWQVHDIAFVPEARQARGRVQGTLYAVDTEGNQAYAFRLEADDDTLSLRPSSQYLPLRRFGGKALVAVGQTVYYDLGDRWLPLLAQPRPRYREEGVFFTDPDGLFDGGQPDCVWHRLFLDACLPPGAQVRVESRAANDATLLANTPWQQEPRLYLRSDGAEIPYYQPFTSDERKRDGAGTWELLFQQAKGRYLQLRLTLRGTGRNSPRIDALRLYFPRFSYLNEYLPDVYQLDETSASFFDRFLANPEGIFTDLEGKIAEIQILFDTRTIPAEYLDWLACWLGTVLDPAFGEAKRRLFIDHVVALFKQRGTLPGLIRAIRLVLDPCPDDSLFDDAGIACDLAQSERCATAASFSRYGVRLIEQFLTRSAPGVLFGDPTAETLPRLTTADQPWTPQDGAGLLHSRFQAFLDARYATDEARQAVWPGNLADVRLSPVLPADTAQQDDWRAFTASEVGFTYAEVNADDTPAYRAFLARRYAQISALNDAYQHMEVSFATIELPEEDDFPADGAWLYDWIQFVSLALPIQRNAHLFTVLVPTEPGSDLEAQAEVLALVARIVEREKPVHTSFEVRPYWALFRVGTARLGLDTLLDEGSRYVALLLGQGFLAEGFLASAHPWKVLDRIVVGRDAPGSATSLA